MFQKPLEKLRVVLVFFVSCFVVPHRRLLLIDRLALIMGLVEVKIPGVRAPFIATLVLLGLATLFGVLATIWMPVFSAIFHQQINQHVRITGPVCSVAVSPSSCPTPHTKLTIRE